MIYLIKKISFTYKGSSLTKVYCTHLFDKQNDKQNLSKELVTLTFVHEK